MKKNEKLKKKILPDLFNKSLILDSQIYINFTSILMNNSIKRKKKIFDNWNFNILKKYLQKINKNCKKNKKTQEREIKLNFCKILKSINDERIIFRKIAMDFLKIKFFQCKESLKNKDFFFNKISGINENIKNKRIKKLEKNIFLLKEKIDDLEFIISEKSQKNIFLEKKLSETNSYLKKNILNIKNKQEEKLFDPNLKPEDSIFSINISHINKIRNTRKTKIKRKCSLYNNQNTINYKKKKKKRINMKNKVLNTTSKKIKNEILETLFVIKPYRKSNSYFDDKF